MQAAGSAKGPDLAAAHAAFEEAGHLVVEAEHACAEAAAARAEADRLARRAVTPFLLPPLGQSNGPVQLRHAQVACSALASPAARLKSGSCMGCTSARSRKCRAWAVHENYWNLAMMGCNGQKKKPG
jgi:hypothetical protein